LLANCCWQIITTITVDEFAPGAKSIFSFTIPDHNSGKVNMSLPMHGLQLDCSFIAPCGVLRNREKRLISAQNKAAHHLMA
jgi:hypothetical protein